MEPKTELHVFLKMLIRAGIGHGTRTDHNPPGTGVQVEFEDVEATTDWQFDAQGNLVFVVLCASH